MTNDIIKAAQKALGSSPPNASSLAKETILQEANLILQKQTGLDAYLAFDTTTSMEPYRHAVQTNIGQVTSELLEAGEDIRVSINGIADHCDSKWLQMYPLSSRAKDVRHSIESIISNINGGDIPEAYECLALALAQRIPQDSVGRKRAVILIADSTPHGMTDAECIFTKSYSRAFAAMKTVCDAFYLVGCDPNTYHLQQQLIDSSKPEREQFIPLGEMAGILPQLVVALVKKTYSTNSLQQYLHKLERENLPGAHKIKGLLGI